MDKIGNMAIVRIWQLAPIVPAARIMRCLIRCNYGLKASANAVVSRSDFRSSLL